MDRSTDTTPIHSNPSDPKTDILKSLQQINEWRKEKLKAFCLQNTGYNAESQNNLFQELKENAGDNLAEITDKSNFPRDNLAEITDKSNFPRDSLAELGEENTICSDSTTDSTLTSHMKRCFNVSSENNSVLLKNEDEWNAPFKNITKPLKPFLRKGDGHIRYLPKAVRETKVHEKNNKDTLKTVSYSQFASNLKLPSHKKRADLQRTSVFQKKFVHFKDPEHDILVENSKGNISESNLKEVEENSKCNNDKSNRQQVEEVCKSVMDSQNFTSDVLPQNGNIECDEQNEKTHADIAEFNTEEFIQRQEEDIEKLHEYEILESLAQNSSFNSDSSVVQRVLNGEPLHTFPLKQPVSSEINWENKLPTKTEKVNSQPPKIDYSKILQQALRKKQRQIDNNIEDTKSRIINLQEKISNPEMLSDGRTNNNERCSTPLGQHIFQNEVPTTSTINCQPVSEPLTDVITKNAHTLNNLGGLKTQTNIVNDKDHLCGDSSSPIVTDNSSEQSILRKKIKELEIEIEMFQEKNAHLSELCKEREELLRRLNKERDDFEKYKEEEKKKIEVEIGNKRRELKRQKENLDRFHKLQKETFTRKEKEELILQRQEVQNLQKELKQQRLRFKADSTRMRNQLMQAENERDSLKITNIQLEEQVTSLIKRLKSENSLCRKANLSANNQKIMCDKSTSPIPDLENNNGIDFFNKKKSLTDKDNSSLKLKVRFNLIPQFEEKLNKSEDTTTSYETETEEQLKSSDVLNEDFELKSAKLDSDDALVQEIKYDDKIEKIHMSGDKEIIFSCGKKKFIRAADGKTTVTFHNGDMLEIFPDKREIYTYIDGLVEECFPPPIGLKVIKFPNGQIEHQYSDGSKEVKFPDGTLHLIYSDGTEKITGIDGTVATIANGIEVIRKKNGEKEIRTPDFMKREFIDGSVRILHKNGKLETRYANGRIKIKDKDGKLIIDTKYL